MNDRIFLPVEPSDDQNDRRRGYVVVIVVSVLVLALAGGALAAFVGWLDRITYEPAIARSSADMVWLRKESVTLTASGTNGSASGTAATDRDLHGYVYAIHLDWTAGISSTTDITITQASPSLTILQLTNTVTDTWYYPTVAYCNSTGSALTAYEKPIIADAIDFSVGQTTSGTVGIATVLWGQ